MVDEFEVTRTADHFDATASAAVNENMASLFNECIAFLSQECDTNTGAQTTCDAVASLHKFTNTYYSQPLLWGGLVV